MYDRKEISKIVKVSDPEKWYGQDTIKVSLFICPEYQGETDVRILIESIDDFAMEYTRTCHRPSRVNFVYEIMKVNMFDTMPEEISYKWLLEHGYFPF